MHGNPHRGVHEIPDAKESPRYAIASQRPNPSEDNCDQCCPPNRGITASPNSEEPSQIIRPVPVIVRTKQQWPTPPWRVFMARRTWVELISKSYTVIVARQRRYSSPPSNYVVR